MFFLWTVVLTDLLPATLTAALIVAAHRWSRTPRALHAWSRALSILGAQLIFVAVLMALLLIAIFSYPDASDPRPIPLTAYLAALFWCAGPAASGVALRAGARSLERKADRTIAPRDIEAFS
jgi:hypothetical protein